MKMLLSQSHALQIAVRGVLLSVLVSAVPGLCQSNASYQPSQRQRTALESCMKDEVSEGAYCIKKCQPNFRLDAQKGKTPVCVATSAAARAPVSTAAPAWEPPPKAAKVPGA